jgi:hypothetical protein
MPVFHAAAQVWPDSADVLKPLLRFWNEFVSNRSGRVVFDCASANGLLLFKETSKFLAVLGTAIKSAPAVSSNVREVCCVACKPDSLVSRTNCTRKSTRSFCWH